jgi:hypothetical protein
MTPNLPCFWRAAPGTTVQVCNGTIAASAKQSACGDTGKSAKTPADARGQGTRKGKARLKDAVRSSSGEFRTVTQAVGKAETALAVAEGKFSKVAGRLTGEAGKKLKTRLGKLGSRVNGLLKLVVGEDG